MEIERLIEQCRQGNREALGDLYKAYAQRMRGICRHYVCDPEAVDDVLHDAFIVIFTSFDRLRNEEKAEAWMTGIVRNVALKYRKRIMAVKTVSENEVNEEALSSAAEPETTEPMATFVELMEMVDRLPEGYGKVFRLSVFEGLSHKEIAEELGIEPHSSSSQLARAKKMMRKMIKQYRLWLLIPLLVAVPLIILYYKQNAIDKKTANLPVSIDANPDIKETGNIAEHGEALKVSPCIPSATTSIGHLSVTPMQIYTYDADRSPKAVITDVLAPDSIPGITAQQECPDIVSDKEQSNTVFALPTDTVTPTRKTEAWQYNQIALRKRKTKDNRSWNIFLAYNGSVQGEKSRINDYMTIPSLSKDGTRSTKIYNWGECMDYVIGNAHVMDPLIALNMYNMALANSKNPQNPITEKSKHERPLTLQLLFSRQISSHWSFTTGLSLTGMKSSFESSSRQAGSTPAVIYRTQRIHYLGVPVKAGFSIAERNRMSIYASGGILFDFPVSARQTTRFVYSDPYDSSYINSDISTGIHAPGQLSFGVGVGLQYEILPHINIFLEPSISYYLTDRQGIETYRTEHPFDISIPVGIKLSW
ncbi:MAG: sigma-70 family RNA polymerase sigma factor [Muribaculaceae bacterium]|nr:sigma-70 family RNA polymerase sigma factor [Muribaculaceae bacterium]